MGSKHIIDGSVINEANPLMVQLVGGKHVISNPPDGCCKVTNLYVDPETGRLTVEYDDEPVE